MAWLPIGLTAIVVCDHGTVKRTGVRAGAGRRGHFLAPAGLECESPAGRATPCPRGSCNLLEVGMRERRPPLKSEPQERRSYTVRLRSSSVERAGSAARGEQREAMVR